jgi:membrane protease subunit HflC
VLDVRIKRINLPQDSEILASVFNRMRAERSRVANQLRAEGEQAAQGIRAEAERERQVLLADAERDAQTQRGEGDSRAAEIGGQAYGRTPSSTPSTAASRPTGARCRTARR